MLPVSVLGRNILAVAMRVVNKTGEVDTLGKFNEKRYEMTDA